MELSALLTSAGINIGLCLLFVSLYSILRKQPGNRIVYFGRKLTEKNKRMNSEHVGLNRIYPSLRWLIKTWNSSEDDILQCAGFDAVVFLRILVFSIRVFVVAFMCGIVVIIVNYNGKNMTHKVIPSEPLEIFAIANIKEGSKCLWVHCMALYIITLSAIYLLHHEYKSIARMRISHVRKPPAKVSQFSILVRSIPKSDQCLSDTVSSFFTNYHAASYLSHQIVYPAGKYQKLMATAHKVYRKFVRLKISSITSNDPSGLYRCGLCGGSQPTRFRHLSTPSDSDQLPQNPAQFIMGSKDCVSAFVFFKTRYAATIASGTVQSSNPMLWVTQESPEPHDVYWSNLSIPYKQLWFRRILVLVLSLVFMFVFLLPVTAVQGLTQLDTMKKVFPFFKELLNKPYVMKVVTGYLPSVILLTAFSIVAPLMMFFSAIEGWVSRSARKKSACFKVTYFTIWNVFFVNVLSGSAISVWSAWYAMNAITRPKDMASHLAEAVPKQATFFITYVLTSGWTSLCSEILQIYPLIYYFVRYKILRIKDEVFNPEMVPSFPYHTEIPKVLLFGLLGFTCAIHSPLILPILLIYFFMAYIIYRNQILNVYVTKYDTGGKMWPLVHDTTIFSLVLTQVIAIGVFGIKRSKFGAGLTIPLVILTLLFNHYTRQRFLPIFSSLAAQDLIEMDRNDEISGRMEEIHEHVLNAYNQFSDPSKETEDEEEEDIDEIDLYGKEYTDSVVADPNPLSSSFSQEMKPMRAELDIV